MSRLLFATMAWVVSVSSTSVALAGEPDAPDSPIGEEVSQICFAQSINGFRTIDGVDNVVVLEKGVRDAYRVELSGLCKARTLSFAQSVAIDRRPAGGCVTRGDVLVFSGSAFFNDRPIERTRCVVTRIDKWIERAGETAR